MHPQRRLNICAIALYLALGTMFVTAPQYVSENLGGSRALAGLSVSIFFLAAVVTRPIVGRLADVHGRRPFLVWSPFVIAGLLVAMLGARWIPAVLAVRFALGVFGAVFYTVAVTASTDLSPGRHASAVAKLSISIYIGFAIGPPIGEALLGLAVPLAWLVPAALALAAGLMIFGIDETQPAQPEHVETARSTFADAAPGPTGAGPVVHEAVPSSRLILGILHPAAILPGITLLTLGIGYQSITSQARLYAPTIGLTTSSPLFGAYAISILLVRLVSGRLADRVGPVKVMFPGIGCFVVGFLLLSQLASPIPAVVGTALVGTGWALVFPAVIAWLAGRVPPAERGSALGSLISFMDIGQGTAGYAVGAVADSSGYASAFLVPAVAAAGGGAVLGVAVRTAPEGPDTTP